MSVNPTTNLPTTGGGSSGYNTGGLTSSSAAVSPGPGSGGQNTKEKMELEAREKLKEELLRQYEALNPGVTAPRQIPTIEENRASSGSTVKRLQVVARAPSYFPDVSRPPPGYCALPPQVPPGLQLYHQAQPLQLSYNYEESLVTRLLQTLVSTVAAPPPQLPLQVTPGPVDKVLNWDTTGTAGGPLAGANKLELSSISHRSRSPPSFSRDRYDQPQCRPGSRRSPSFLSQEFRRRSRPRRRSLSRSPDRRRDFSGAERSRQHSDRARREVRHSPRQQQRRERRDREGERSRERERERDWSPLTKYFQSPGRETSERARGYKRSHRRDHRRSSHREGSPSHSSPKRKRCQEERKIVPSPRRSHKSIRDIINDERDSRPSQKPAKKLPAKKRVKDRLGTKPAAITEIFNMEPSEGKVGGVAIIKEYVDSKLGLLELRTSEGGRGSTVLFSVDEVWVPDRQGNPNGAPKLLTECDQGLELAQLFPLGLEVLINARRVRSDLIDLQATVVWPKFTEVPLYKLKPSKLDADEAKFHSLCSRLKKMTPICINGLPGTGSLNIWSAKVQEILDEDWGLVEVSSYPRDAKKEFSYKFICFFHKWDVWVDDGVCVGDHQFYREKPLSAILELLQPVNLVARSIIREKGQFMKKSTGTTIEMQAVCISLLPWTIPKGAPLGTRVEGGPGAFGGCNRGETPYIFKPNFYKTLNLKLAKFLKVYKKKISVDPEIEAKLPSVPEEEREEPRGRPPSTDLENNEPSLRPLLSNVEAVVRKGPAEAGQAQFGLAEVVGPGWLCLFTVEDCVAGEGASYGHQFQAGTRVFINANLLDSAQQVQYVTSCVWRKSESSLALPNITDKSQLPQVKLDLYESVNRDLRELSDLPSQLEEREGTILKILDQNFGLISQAGKFVLFDTCDFWSGAKLTGAEDKLKLKDVVSEGDQVLLHAALVDPEARVPYLATAVWKDEEELSASPAAILRSKIHPDKIQIYRTVSTSSTVTESLDLQTKSHHPNLDSFRSRRLVNVSGIVKFGILLNKSLSTAAGIVEIAGAGNNNILGFYLISHSLEISEQLAVCVPGTKVRVHASPLARGFGPVTHLVTLISSIHTNLPQPQNHPKISCKATKVLSQIQKSYDLAELSSRKPDIICYNLTGLSKMVSHCQPTGRLVCMLGDTAGILEDHRRQLAYFELADTNLPPDLTMKDVVLIMTRCRDVSIRFQASSVLAGPVKMIVHDGTVSISSNLKKYYPEVKLKKAPVIMKPNFFSEEKLARAKEALELFKEGKVLVCEDIVKSTEYPSLLLSPKNYRVAREDEEVRSKKSSSDRKERKVENKEEPVKSRCNGEGRLRSILNEHFGLIEFSSSDGKPQYVIFDTFDLYLQSGNTAAGSKLSVDQVLKVGEEICFNAYEICPSNCVSWLANGVWRPSVKSPPRPVSFRDISKEKISVFEKVSETCASVLPALKHEKEELKEEEVTVKHEASEAAAEDEDGDSLPKVLDQRVDVIGVSKSEEDYAIVALNLDSKEVKCLVHLNRVRVEDRSLEDEQDWKTFERAKTIVLKARRIRENVLFQYQASYAMVSTSPVTEEDQSEQSEGNTEDLDKNL